MNRKIIAVTAVVLSICLTGCGSTEDSAAQDNKTTTAVTTTVETTAEVTTEAETTTAAETTEAATEADTAEASEAEDATDGTSENAELEQIAIRKMNALTKINGYVSGKIGSDENDIIADKYGADLIRVNEPGINSIADIEAIINDTCTGKLKEGLLKSVNNLFAERDGKLYYYYTAHGFNIYITEGGVKLSNVTENSFTAETVCKNQLSGDGKLNFVRDGDNWLITNETFE
ncbi:MAG: hypothetical protein IKW96_06075 [Ruminococcus sp.]|uniref:hypothetical protein n=1 Tax=Ruminococcus sp. TaxID=41978 RepID=UPI0025F76096|nr:hypothetical protein [Ruminococcus sp.]MBR5682829.1 hypothetical protein [Ruminococcus sp.]